VGDWENRTQKKEKGLDFFSKRQRIIKVVSTLQTSLVYVPFCRNWPSVKHKGVFEEGEGRIRPPPHSYFFYIIH